MELGELYRQADSAGSDPLRADPRAGRAACPWWHALEPLDAEALVRILTEPKNALLKQYERAVPAWTASSWSLRRKRCAPSRSKTLERNTGARGLRSVMEELLTGLMFRIPSDPTVVKALVDEPMCDRGARSRS